MARRRTGNGTGRHRRGAAGGPGDARAGMDGPATDAVLRMGRFFRAGEVSADNRALHRVGGRDADSFHRGRWSHDEVVRSTHGVNCTGSYSWKVYGDRRRHTAARGKGGWCAPAGRGRRDGRGGARAHDQRSARAAA